MAEKQFRERDIIFREGTKADVAYILHSGVVEILKQAEGGDVKLAEINAGEIFGEMALLDESYIHSASARAKSDVTVDIITAQELHEMVAQCPPRLVPILEGLFDRLRKTNLRVKTKEQVTAILEADLDKVVVSALAEEMAEFIPAAELPVTHLPLRIGGYPKGEEVDRNRRNHVNIASDGPPLTVSATHCEITIQDGKLYLRDLGSRHGTVVNGLPIGRGRGEYKAPLQKGDNQVILGDKKTSPYTLLVRCE